MKNYIHGSIEKYGTSLGRLADSKPNKNSRSGVKGVYLLRDGTYLAQIGLRKKQKTIGRFTSFNDAVAARHKAEEILYGPILKAAAMNGDISFKDMDTRIQLLDDFIEECKAAVPKPVKRKKAAKPATDEPASLSPGDLVFYNKEICLAVLPIDDWHVNAVSLRTGELFWIDSDYEIIKRR